MASKRQPPRHWVRFPFEYLGQPLDRGQVFTLQNAPNDEKLLRLEYVMELPRGSETYECSECGAEFIGIPERTAHGNARHFDRELSPLEEDRRAEREERRLMELAPLNYEKTLASMREGQGGIQLPASADAAAHDETETDDDTDTDPEAGLNDFEVPPV